MNANALAEVWSAHSNLDLTSDELITLGRVRSQRLKLYYLHLRRAFCDEYRFGLQFALPARGLAADEFLPGFRDRKTYLKFNRELAQTGLIRRVDARNGQTAVYVFASPNVQTARIVSLKSGAGGRRGGEVTLGPARGPQTHLEKKQRMVQKTDRLHISGTTAGVVLPFKRKTKTPNA